MNVDATGSKELAAEIQRIGKTARTEEDVRINVEQALKPALNKLGIKSEPRYEQRLTLLQGTGYADAVYGFVSLNMSGPVNSRHLPDGKKWLSSYPNISPAKLASLRRQSQLKLRKK